MKSIKYFFILLVLSFSTGYTQSTFVIPKTDKGIQKSYPIDGTYLLEAQNNEVYKYFKNNPAALTQQKLNKVQDWGFTVGTNKSFYAYNFTNSTRYSTSFTCRAVGNNCYIFVEDSVWDTRVDQSAVDSVLKAFDSSTPANPSLGIYHMDVNAFGTPPDVDNDPRVVILILNIRDGWTGSGGYVAGYFDSYNEVLSYANSNKGEFYYVDANPLNLKSPYGIQTGMSTTAHEFQHMINFNYHTSNPQLTFINESCSMLAELYCGYPPDNQAGYANETNYYLFGWRGNDNTLVLNDYSRAQKFSWYLCDQFGIGLFKYIVQSSNSFGIDIINDALQKYGQSATFNDVFRNWLIANTLNDTTVDRSYGYDYPNITKSKKINYNNPNSSGSNILDNLSADYISFANGSNLNITFTTANSSIIVKAIKYGTSIPEVVDVPTNSAFNVPDFGTTYSSITFIIINAFENGKQSYSFNSTGTVINSAQELKWDTTEPTGYYNFTTGDTVAVQFDAFPGAKLDSIRVALRRAGSITGGVWEFTGNIQPTPLGKKLAAPITASISTQTTLPYPIPYKNWTTVDLRSYSISTDKNFVVGFVIGEIPNAPAVMATDFPSTGPYHSFTYLQVADGVPAPNWYYITSGTDTVAIYLIRAYASLVTSAGTETVVELTPKDFSLEQNYPNPFNPSTVINYKLADREFVSLKVYDLLGNEISTLVNEEKPAGNYRVEFNPSAGSLHLANGVYFYRLQAGNFIETKKMILLK
jgi:hypothetical protein